MSFLSRPSVGCLPRVLLTLVGALVLAVVARATIGASLQTQLGIPSGSTTDPTNHGHYLIQRDQYGLDYDDTTREPNWVSWDLTSSDVRTSGRSDFTQDTTLPEGFYQVLATDYRGSGYDRGHMCPSADRTVTAADNQQVFFMSNMVPQSPDNNQGVWANFETYCRSLASQGNEILLICGPSGFDGSTLASGVAIPGYTWKIAVVVPLGSGSAVSRITASTRVIAIKVPNIAGVRSTPWENFVTSVAQLESDTGYTFFTNLPADVRATLRMVVDGTATFTDFEGNATGSAAWQTVVNASTTQVFYTGGTYSQDFDSLPNSGTFTFTGAGPFYLSASAASTLGVDAANLGGWSIAKIGGSGASQTLLVGTGSANNGAAYSFGASGSTDRALGAVLSGSVASTWGVTLVNNTGQTLSQFKISYAGEQWRYGGGMLGGTDKIYVEYQLGGTDILSGTFTGIPALDFTSPINSATSVGTAGARDGNANRGLRTATITGISWSPGQTLVLRWRDFDVAGSDDGLAIDDFTFTAASPVAPAIVTQPTSGIVPAGASAGFTEAATGTEPFICQWREEGTPILGDPTTGPATVAVTVTGFVQKYDGAPKPVSVETAPSGLPVEVTYNGSTTAPTNPGAYAVAVSIADPNYAGTFAGTLLIKAASVVRHAPSVNGGIDGSIQVLSAEDVLLNSAGWISGDLLVAGTPDVVLNGYPTYGGSIDGSGQVDPADHRVVLNGGAVLRHVVRRTDAIPLPSVATPPAPAGTRDVTLSNARQTVGDLTTVRNLTLNGNAGVLAVPAGTYGNVTANANATLVLGTAGVKEPLVYNLQTLTLNGRAQIQVVGPVVLNLANGAMLNGVAGASEHPEWLTIAVANGGVTVNAAATVHGSLVAPSGTVVVTGTIHGTTISDTLIVNGDAAIIQP